jgi:hypothetical protein
MPEKRVTARQRKAVTERALGCCEYCQSQARFATQSFSIEHIIPRSRGGKNELKNLALACEGCNGHKHTKTEGYDPVAKKYVHLFHPRRHKWREHFCWNDDFTIVLGLTSVGRATVATLHLNREELVNLREVLHLVGKHPPEEFNLS